MNRDNDKPPNTSPTKPPPVGNTVNSSDAQGPSDKQANPPKKPYCRKWHKYLELCFAGTVAAFTVVLADTAYKQFDIMKAQWETMEKTVKIQERPWITIKSINLENPTVELPIVAVRYRNTGHSPAIKSTIKHWPAFIRPDLFGRMSFPEIPTVDYSSSAVVGPDIIKRNQFTPNTVIDNDSGMSRAVTKESLQEWRAGKLTLYSIGKIEYTDVFGDVHETIFCQHFIPSTGRFADCDKWNAVN